MLGADERAFIATTHRDGEVVFHVRICGKRFGDVPAEIITRSCMNWMALDSPFRMAVNRNCKPHHTGPVHARKSPRPSGCGRNFPRKQKAPLATARSFTNPSRVGGATALFADETTHRHRQQRAQRRSREVNPEAGKKFPPTSAGARERAGFIDAPEIGPAKSASNAMTEPTAMPAVIPFPWPPSRRLESRASRARSAPLPARMIGVRDRRAACSQVGFTWKNHAQNQARRHRAEALAQ